MQKRPNRADLLAAETPGGRGLLAAELAQHSGRQHGPVDGCCEVCGSPAADFVLQDWLHWHCLSCAAAAA